MRMLREHDEAAGRAVNPMPRGRLILQRTALSRRVARVTGALRRRCTAVWRLSRSPPPSSLAAPGPAYPDGKTRYVRGYVSP
jgi:hypothetical protein